MRYLILVLLLAVGTASNAQKLPYANQTDIGLLLGENVEPAFSAQMFNGVRLEQWDMEVGITAGIDAYEHITLLPVSASIKWNPFNKHNNSPYLNVQAGYGFDWLQRANDEWYDGGYMLNASLGLRMKTNKRAGINVSIGLRQQRASMYSPGYDSFLTANQSFLKEQYTFKRVQVGLGVSF